jgi:hypothetical protein
MPIRPRNYRPLSLADVLKWADHHHTAKGVWPTRNSGPVLNQLGEVWGNIDAALIRGERGLLGGSSLAQLLAARRGKRNRKQLPRLSVDEILSWADLHRERTGKFPTPKSGPVIGAEAESWNAIDQALREGGRGFPGGSSLICLLAEARQATHRLHPGRLRVSEVLAWADAHHRQKGAWPNQFSGLVTVGSPLTWAAVNESLRHGRRGLPGGTTLFRFLVKHGRLPAP